MLHLHSQAAQDEEALNGVRYQLVAAERRSDKLAGHRSKDESEAFNAQIQRLATVLQNARADSQMLTLQITSSLKDLGAPLKFYSFNCLFNFFI